MTPEKGAVFAVVDLTEKAAVPTFPAEENVTEEPPSDTYRTKGFRSDQRMLVYYNNRVTSSPAATFKLEATDVRPSPRIENTSELTAVALNK